MGPCQSGVVCTRHQQYSPLSYRYTGALRSEPVVWCLQHGTQTAFKTGGTQTARMARHQGGCDGGWVGYSPWLRPTLLVGQYSLRHADQCLLQQPYGYSWLRDCVGALTCNRPCPGRCPDCVLHDTSTATYSVTYFIPRPPYICYTCKGMPFPPNVIS